MWDVKRTLVAWRSSNMQLVDLAYSLSTQHSTTMLFSMPWVMDVTRSNPISFASYLGTHGRGWRRDGERGVST